MSLHLIRMRVKPRAKGVEDHGIPSRHFSGSRKQPDPLPSGNPQVPLLTPQEELDLSRRWRKDEDTSAAHRLVTSHLRLVAKIAMGYRGYGLPVNELISEGNIGMMQAVRRFDPERGFRLATYAMWWIRAAMQEYILHSWSLVKMGTTAAQKKLFFNLRRLKGQMQAIDDGDLKPEQVNSIATTSACRSRTWFR